MDVRELLKEVKEGTLSIEDAAIRLENPGFKEMGYAKLDTDRTNRQGFPETVYCSGKKDEYLIEIYKRLYEANGCVLGTRANKHQYEIVKAELPQVEYYDESHILKIDSCEKTTIGKVVVCTAGTADIPVAKEAAITAEFLGANVVSLFDVGVSGIHRLLHNKDAFNGANAVVVVAGMEGALASVVGGLVSCPVIAVPTSVGYGASFGGVSALLTMINSCANGVATVNIDNGYGAGFLAAQINRQSVKDGE